MCYCLDKEQAVAGFVNCNRDGLKFVLRDVYDYLSVLWNAGCGPIRLNFTRKEMEMYLDRCGGICVEKEPSGWKINKSYLSEEFRSEEEREFLHGDRERARQWDLFCRLQVDFRTPRCLLDAMGFRFVHTG